MEEGGKKVSKKGHVICPYCGVKLDWFPPQKCVCEAELFRIELLDHFDRNSPSIATLKRRREGRRKTMVVWEATDGK
jgi:hypothetical protein